MQSSALFWPSGRRLFRKRSRARTFGLVLAILAVAVLAAAFGPIDWR
jgi:hypothetical protein